jgi:hypothetical protein
MTLMLRSLLLLLLAVPPALAQSPPADAEARTGNRPPQVLALNVTPSAPAVGESVRLRAFGEDPDGDPLRWTWTIDGVPQDTDQPEVLLKQPAPGEYAVRAVVEDGRGGRTESALRFKVFQPTWCAEASVFHDETTLTAFYTGAPSLTVARQNLIDGFLQVLRDYRAAGATSGAGGRRLDAPTLPRSLESGAVSTGFETAIRTQAADRARVLGRGLTPPELFAVALAATGGDVGTALLASHVLTYPDTAQANAAFIREHLAPLRDPRGYSREPAVRAWNARSREWQFVAAAEIVGSDQQGAWAALFGAIAVAFTDRHGQLPLWLFREHALPPIPALPLAARDLTAPQQVQLLADYAIRLAERARAGIRATPDPDRVCLRYSGAAVGTALAEALAEPDSVATPMPTPTTPGTPYGSYLIQPPLSIELRGAHGERIGFDQAAGRYTGNTVNAIVDSEAIGDAAIATVITPLFPVSEITLSSAGTGLVQFGAADLDAGFSRVWELPVTPGASFRYQPAYALTDADGAVVEHAAELHHDRQWAFPQAPMLIIGLASALGLLLGLIWVWRRGPFAPAPRLPAGSMTGDGSPQCSACGATTRPGARFCRQCGRQLR